MCAVQIQVAGGSVASPDECDATSTAASGVAVHVVRPSAVAVRRHRGAGADARTRAAGAAAAVASVPGARAGQQVQPDVPAPPCQQTPSQSARATDRELLADARAHHQQDSLQCQGAQPHPHRALRRRLRPAQRALQRGLPGCLHRRHVIILN